LFSRTFIPRAASIYPMLGGFVFPRIFPRAASLVKTLYI